MQQAQLALSFRVPKNKLKIQKMYTEKEMLHQWSRRATPSQKHICTHLHFTRGVSSKAEEKDVLLFYSVQLWKKRKKKDERTITTLDCTLRDTLLFRSSVCWHFEVENEFCCRNLTCITSAVRPPVVRKHYLKKKKKHTDTTLCANGAVRVKSFELCFKLNLFYVLLSQISPPILSPLKPFQEWAAVVDTGIFYQSNSWVPINL